MNNKQIGTEFEHEMVELLTQEGYWVHFIAPDSRGAQPFDIIAVKNGEAFAIDCKTCVANKFTIRRLEYNQIFAFELWMKRGNKIPLIMVKHDDKIYKISYDQLRRNETIKLNTENEWKGKEL